MNERCVDASLIVKLALEDEAHSAAARHLVRQSVADGIRLIAPPIFTAEIDSVIRRCVCTGRLSQSDAREASFYDAVRLGLPFVKHLADYSI